MVRIFLTVAAMSLIAGCVTCPSDQVLLDIGSEAQFGVGHLYIGFEANRDVLATNDQAAVQAIGRYFSRELQVRDFANVDVYVAIGQYEGDLPDDRDLALRRFEHVEKLLQDGGLKNRIVGVSELPEREQLRRVDDGVYIGLRCD